MDVARKVRLMHKRSKFFAGQFFVDFLDLGRKAIIRASPALADEARDLHMGFQRGPDLLDASLCLLERAVDHRTDLLP